MTSSFADYELQCEPCGEILVTDFKISVSGEHDQENISTKTFHHMLNSQELRKLLPATEVIWALRAQSCKESRKMSSQALSAPGSKKSRTESKRVNYFSTILTLFRLRFGLFGPWGRQGPGTHFPTLVVTLGPKGPNDPCSRQKFSQLKNLKFHQCVMQMEERGAQTHTFGSGYLRVGRGSSTLRGGGQKFSMPLETQGKQHFGVLSWNLSAPKSQRFLRFAIAMPIADPRNRAISETRESNAALRFKGEMESR